MFIVYLHIIFRIELFAVHTESSHTLLMRYYKKYTESLNGLL